jgi:hypothetical protein
LDLNVGNADLQVIFTGGGKATIALTRGNEPVLEVLDNTLRFVGVIVSTDTGASSVLTASDAGSVVGETVVYAGSVNEWEWSGSKGAGEETLSLTLWNNNLGVTLALNSIGAISNPVPDRGINCNGQTFMTERRRVYSSSGLVIVGGNKLLAGGGARDAIEMELIT